MSAKLIELAERRTTLVAKAATQRTELSQALEPWREPLAVVDQGMRVARYLKRHPALSIGAAAAMAVLRPRRTLRWLRSGWLVWGIAMNVKHSVFGN